MINTTSSLCLYKNIVLYDQPTALSHINCVKKWFDLYHHTITNEYIHFFSSLFILALHQSLTIRNKVYETLDYLLFHVQHDQIVFILKVGANDA